MQNTNEDTTKQFKPEEHLMQIKSKEGSKDYLPVQWRLVWFRSAFPHGTIETEMLHLDLDRDTEEEVYVWNAEQRRSEKVMKTGKGFAVFHAVVTDGLGGRGEGTKSEKAASFPDWIEKSETGAIGRALASLGYGTQFTDEEDAKTGTETKQRPGCATPNQLASARNLATLLKRESPLTEETSESDAARLIKELAAEYKSVQEKARQAKAS